MADTWTAIGGYTPQDYSDTLVFEMSSATKQVEKILGQALVAGEENSQYIKFVLPRYWDGIDISSKTFTIEYALAGTYYGTSEAVNAEMSDEQVRFGWVVPESACAISGTLFFVLKVESSDYILKSQIVEVPVYKTINVEGVVPEPTKEAWYREFAARVETAISEAESALSAAQEAQASAETAAQNAQTAEDIRTAIGTTTTALNGPTVEYTTAQASIPIPLLLKWEWRLTRKQLATCLYSLLKKLSVIGLTLILKQLQQCRMDHLQKQSFLTV